MVLAALSPLSLGFSLTPLAAPRGGSSTVVMKGGLFPKGPFGGSGRVGDRDPTAGKWVGDRGQSAQVKKFEGGSDYLFFQGPAPKTAVQEDLPSFFSAENLEGASLPPLALPFAASGLATFAFATSILVAPPQMPAGGGAPAKKPAAAKKDPAPAPAAPASEAKAEAPKAEAPKAEAPKAEAPAAAATQAEAPRADAPQAEAPQAKAPEAAAPEASERTVSVSSERTESPPRAARAPAGAGGWAKRSPRDLDLEVQSGPRQRPAKRARAVDPDAPCRALPGDKAEWAQREMEAAYADEVGFAYSPPAGGPGAWGRGKVAEGEQLLMSEVVQRWGEFTLPVHVGDRRKREASKDPISEADARRAGRPAAFHGAASGATVGQLWLSREQLSKAGVHGPWVAGISGRAAAGAFSIVLSGGYEGDVDEGDSFTYTGSGGRDLSGNKRVGGQVSDQLLAGLNKALVVNLWRGLPVRVTRGSKLKSAFSPEAGYRYDGLYAVEEVWPQLGPSGHVIWRYRLRRADGQAPVPWAAESWRERERAAVEGLQEQNQGKALIPVGTGTLGLNLPRGGGAPSPGARKAGAGLAAPASPAALGAAAALLVSAQQVSPPAAGPTTPPEERPAELPAAVAAALEAAVAP